MSVSDVASNSITKGKRYSENAEVGWRSFETGSQFGPEVGWRSFESSSRFELETETKEEEDEEQEGDLRAWLTVVGSSLVYFATFGIVNSFGFFQNYYEHSLLKGVPASTISFVGTLQITLMNVLAAPAGALFDCYGLRSLYIFSGISCSGALFGLSLIHSASLWQIFLIQGAFVGIANAFGSQPALVVVGQHFVRRRALVMGIVAAAGSVGGVCFPVIFAKLAEPQSVGYAWSLRVVAAIIAVCYMIATFISTTNMPRQYLRSFKTLIDVRGFLDRRYSVLAAGGFIAMLGQFVPYYYISTYMQTTNPDSVAKDFLLPLMNASSIVGRILGGLAADSSGPTNTIYPMTILSGLLCLGTWAVTSSVPVLLAFVLMYGFCSGIFIGVLPVAVAQIVPAGKMGGRIGAFYSALAIAQLVGSPIGGALIRRGDGQESQGETTAGYLGLILFAGTTLLVGGLVILGSRLLHDRNLRTWY